MIDLINKITVQSLVCTGLIIALLIAIFHNNNDLAVNIASGLIGFLSHKAN